MLEIKLVKIYTNLTSGRRLKTTRWIYAALSLSSFWGQLNEYQNSYWLDISLEWLCSLEAGEYLI